MCNVAGIVLAGGPSSRMGSPKAALEWHGSTLLRRVTGIISRSVDGPVVVVRARGQELPELDPAVEVVDDAREGRGPLQGLAAGLAAISGRAGVAYVSSTDVPLLHPAFVQSVVGSLHDQVDIVLPEVGGYRQPLAAAYRTGVHRCVEALIAADRLRPASLFERCRVLCLSDEALLANCGLARLDPELVSISNLNEPADYHRAHTIPAPEIRVQRIGTLARRSGPRRATVRAWTLGGAAAAIGLALDDRIVAALNRDQISSDPQLPLAAGDAVAFTVARDSRSRENDYRHRGQNRKRDRRVVQPRSAHRDDHDSDATTDASKAASASSNPPNATRPTRVTDSNDDEVAPRMIAAVLRDGQRDEVAVEEPLEVRVDDAPLVVSMRTPGHDGELALGFLYGEGLINEPRRVGLTDDLAANIIEVQGPLARDPAARRFYTTSSCGVCGKGALEEVAVHAPVARRGPRVERPLLASLPDRLRQPTFARTGGLHATGLFTPRGGLLIVREDVGRHNAMDKVVGRALLDGLLPLHDRILCVSGRLSFELVQKAAVAGAPILVGVGAPSSLAIDLAADRGMTLAGFARHGNVNIYTGAERVCG